MSDWICRVIEAIDRISESGVRDSARRSGRRSALARLGGIMVGAAVLPMLPYDKSSAATNSVVADEEDGTKCEYWAYCGLEGTLCAACGGSVSQCPPGSEASKVSWVGTCLRKKDKKAYLVSYSDCCGKAPCQEAECSHHVGERPGYRMGTFSDMNWCMANAGKGVNCSTAVVVGIADGE